MMSRRVLPLLALFLVVCASPNHGQDSAFSVGQTVTFVERAQGIPLHANIGESAVSARLDGGSSATIDQVGSGDQRHWLKVHAGSVTGWVISKYVASTGAGTPPAPTANGICRIAGWNLEWFKDGKDRGFPENDPKRNPRGPTYPSRNDAQIGELADAITQSLDVQFLVLEEIAGTKEEDANGEEHQVSHELDALLEKLPSGWAYDISASGAGQRVAFLYDTNRVRVNSVTEFTVPPTKVQSTDILYRDPLVACVTLLQGGQPRNDLVIVWLHLASGPDKAKNHDAAMTKVLQLIAQAQQLGSLGGTSEQDILLLGDLNANMYEPPAEQFFIDMDDTDGDWDVLADPSYPATRLAGVPLAPGDPIDYIIASRFRGARHGLSGEEITASQATVHTELVTAQGGPDDYRRDLSDHLPVTVDVRVGPDND